FGEKQGPADLRFGDNLVHNHIQLLPVVHWGSPLAKNTTRISYAMMERFRRDWQGAERVRRGKSYEPLELSIACRSCCTVPLAESAPITSFNSGARCARPAIE